MYSYGKNVFFNQGSILIDEIFLSHMPFDINMKDAQLTKTNEKSNENVTNSGESSAYPYLT